MTFCVFIRAVRTKLYTATSLMQVDRRMIGKKL